MSHISTVMSKITFRDTDALKRALGEFGTVLEGTGSISVVLKTPISDIKSISFIQQGNEWEARADQWGNTLNYETFVGRIGQQYTKTLTMNFIAKNHLSIYTTGKDKDENIRIKVRSY